MFANQKIPSLVTISLILMTLMFVSGVILSGEIRCYSLLGFKGLIVFQTIEKILKSSKENRKEPKEKLWPNKGEVIIYQL